MARQTLRDVIDQAIQRAWEAGAQVALIAAGFDAPAALRFVQSDRDPVWRMSRDESVRRQQRIAREELGAAILSAVTGAVEQTRLGIRHEVGQTDVEVSA